MTSWTDHLKAYASKHNVTYKEAMTAAKATYKKGESKSHEMKESKGHEMKESKKKEKKENMHEKTKGEMHDEKMVHHEKKKRESAASALKPRPLKQLM